MSLFKIICKSVIFIPMFYFFRIKVALQILRLEMVKGFFHIALFQNPRILVQIPSAITKHFFDTRKEFFRTLFFVCLKTFFFVTTQQQYVHNFFFLIFKIFLKSKYIIFKMYELWGIEDKHKKTSYR